MCSGWALSIRRCGQAAPMGAERCSCILMGMAEGGLPGTTSPTPHPHPLEEAGPCPGSPGESCSRSVAGWLGLHNFKSGSPGLSEIAGLKGSSACLPEPLALGCWVETCPFYTGGGRGRTSRCFIFYHWCLFPHPRLWGWGDRLGLGRGRGGRR